MAKVLIAVKFRKIILNMVVTNEEATEVQMWPSEI